MNLEKSGCPTGNRLPAKIRGQVETGGEARVRPKYGACAPVVRLSSADTLQATPQGRGRS